MHPDHPQAPAPDPPEPLGGSLSAVFEDLEQQAEGLALGERDAELADRARAEYALVTFDSRLHASAGSLVTLRLRGVGVLAGTLARVGSDWCLVRTVDPAADWVVALPAIVDACGLSRRALSPAVRSVVARLSLGSALSAMAGSATDATVHFVDGQRTEGRLGRVGADFVEVRAADGHRGVPGSASAAGPQDSLHVVRFGALAAVRTVGLRPEIRC